MVTGNKTAFQVLKTDPALTAAKARESVALVSFSPWDFSAALIGGLSETAVSLLAHHHWSEPLEGDLLYEKYDDCLHQLPYRLDHSQRIEAIFDFRKFALLPQSLYEQGKGPEMLSYTAHLQKGEQVYVDQWGPSEAVLAYSLPASLVTWFHKRFQAGRFRQQGSAMHQLYQQFTRQGTFALLHISTGRADLMLARDGKLLFYNQYSYQVEEDILYFVLFAMEQFNLLPTEIVLFLSGKSLRGEKLYQLLENYLAEVQEIPLPEQPARGDFLANREWSQQIHLLGAL